MTIIAAATRSRPADPRSARAAVQRYTQAERAASAVPAHVYRRRRLALVAAVASVLCCVALLGGLAGQADAGLEGPGSSAPVYVVQSGDTLWTIARQLSPGNDPRELVGQLSKAAGGADIIPGQRIELPRQLG